MMEVELERPLSPADVAAAVDSPEVAAEMYPASLFVIGTRDPAGRAYRNDTPLRCSSIRGAGEPA